MLKPTESKALFKRSMDVYRVCVRTKVDILFSHFEIRVSLREKKRQTPNSKQKFRLTDFCFIFSIKQTNKFLAKKARKKIRNNNAQFEHAHQMEINRLEQLF